MEDYIIRGMAADHQVRFFAAYSKNLVEEARKTTRYQSGGYGGAGTASDGRRHDGDHV